MLLAKIPLFWTLVAVVWALVAILLILIVLVQKGKGGGLSGAFGGAGGPGGVLGTKTGDVFTWATIILVAVFLVLALMLNKFLKPSADEYTPGYTQQQTTGTVPEPVTETAQTETTQQGDTQDTAISPVDANTAN